MSSTRWCTLRATSSGTPSLTAPAANDGDLLAEVAVMR